MSRPAVVPIGGVDADEVDWRGLVGGYGVPYDPRPALDAAASGDAAAWSELAENLQHQGDVGIASYAAVPEIVAIVAQSPTGDWRPYALLGSIEECRLTPHNPRVPEWLADRYDAAWARVVEAALRDFAATEDPITATSILAVLAFARALPTIGTICLLTEDERQDLLDAS